MRKMTWGLRVDNLLVRPGKACQSVSPYSFHGSACTRKAVERLDLPAVSPNVFPVVLHAEKTSSDHRTKMSFPTFPQALLLRQRIERI